MQLIKNYYYKLSIWITKYFTVRQIRLKLVELFFSRLSFFRKRYACYVKPLMISDVADQIKFSKQTAEKLILNEHQIEYYKSNRFDITELDESSSLTLYDDEVIYEVHDCEVLTKIGVALNTIHEAILVCEDRKLIRSELKPTQYKDFKQLKGTVISIIRWNDYYHFLFNEIVPLLRILENVPEARNATLLIRDSFAVYQESLIKMVVRIYPDLQLQKVNNVSRIKCEKLLVYCNKRQKLVDYMAHGNTLRGISINMRELIGKGESEPTRKIYISRNRYKYRNLINENEMMQAIDGLGFEIIYPELLSYEEQVRIFSEAKVIIASTGSALTNLLYCNAGATLVELRRNDDEIPPLYLGLSKQMGMNHYFVPTSDQGRYHSYSVDVSLLMSCLQDVINIENKNN